MDRNISTGTRVPSPSAAEGCGQGTETFDRPPNHLCSTHSQPMGFRYCLPGLCRVDHSILGWAFNSQACSPRCLCGLCMSSHAVFLSYPACLQAFISSSQQRPSSTDVAGGFYYSHTNGLLCTLSYKKCEYGPNSG